MQNSELTMRSESRGQTCLHYAEPQVRKALEEGLMQNAKLKITFWATSQECGVVFFLLTIIF